MPLRPRTRSAISAIGWIVPTSLLASMIETRIVRSRERRLELVGIDPPVAVDRQLDDLEPELLEVAQRVPDRVVLDRRGDDPVAARLAGPRRALEGEVVRLRAAGREHDLARLDPEARRAADRAPRRARPAPPRPKACADDGLPNDSVRYGSIASRTSRRTGVVAAWSR